MKGAGRKVKVPYGAVAAIGLVLGALPLRAQAADPAGYVGLGLGMISIPFADAAPRDGTDTSLLAGSLYGGLRFNEIFGIEVGYIKSAKGDIKRRNVDTGVGYGADALYGAVVAHVPTDGALTPFAKVGVHRWELDAVAQSGGVRASVSVDGTDLLLGGGVDWALDDSWSIRAEYVYLHYGEAGVDGKAHVFLVGLARTF